MKDEVGEDMILSAAVDLVQFVSKTAQPAHICTQIQRHLMDLFSP